MTPPSWLIGHRGARGVCLENSLVSFDVAIAAGLSAVELDVHLARDGVPVCSHDASLLRVFGVDRFVGDLTSTELAGISGDYERSVPTLADVLDHCHGRIRVIVEIKVDEHAPGFDADRKVAAEVAALLDGRADAGKSDAVLAVSSFDRVAAQVFQRRSRGFHDKTAQLLTHRASASMGVKRARVDRFTQIHPHYSLILREPWVPTVARRHGIGVSCYTVNDASVARILRRLGVDHVITDYPALNV